MTLEGVYREHFRFVWRSLRRLGIADSDVADAVQDVFLVVHRKLPEWEGRSQMTTWLFGICMRVASDRRRLAYTRRETLSDELQDYSNDCGGNETVEYREQVVLLEALLLELPMEQRAVFTLFELEEMSGEGIAELLEIPLGTVYSRLRIGREAFRGALRRKTTSTVLQSGGRS